MDDKLYQIIESEEGNFAFMVIVPVTWTLGDMLRRDWPSKKAILIENVAEMVREGIEQAENDYLRK